MQMEEETFLKMTWGKFMIHAQGYQKRREIYLEGHRMVALLLYNTNTKKSQRKTAKEFWELPYLDEKVAKKKWDKEKVQELIKKWK